VLRLWINGLDLNLFSPAAGGEKQEIFNAFGHSGVKKALTFWGIDDTIWKSEQALMERVILRERE